MTGNKRPIADGRDQHEYKREFGFNHLKARVMNYFLYGLAAISGFSLFVAAAYPCYVINFSNNESYGLVKRYKLHLLSIFFLFVILYRAIGFSFSNLDLDMMVVFFAIACGGALTLFSFNINYI